MKYFILKDDEIGNRLLELLTKKAKQDVKVPFLYDYFISDEAILEALRTAALSGIDIHIMLPNKVDLLFTTVANLSFAQELLTAGVKIYQYDNGFLHVKTFMIDRKAFKVGSANPDIRSFSLNLEANAFIYDQEPTDIFYRDLKLSSELTAEYFENRLLYEWAKQRVARLIAPIL